MVAPWILYVQRLIDKKALFRFDSEYYINPSFVGSSRSYDTEIIIKMLEEDPDLESFIDEKVFYKIRSHKRIENMNWWIQGSIICYFGTVIINKTPLKKGAILSYLTRSHISIRTMGSILVAVNSSFWGIIQQNKAT